MSGPYPEWRRLAMVVLALAAGLGGAPLRAHEMNPAIADLALGASPTLTLELQLEAHLAGVDLDRYQDTNASPEAARYDALRALDPEALSRELERSLEAFLDGIDLRAGSARLTLELVEASIPEVGDLETSRLSRLTLRALGEPPLDAPWTLGWIRPYGALVVRQIDAGEDGYAGFVLGGERAGPMTAPQRP